MGKYVQSTLISDEQVIYEAKLSFWSDLPAILLGFFLLTFYGLGLVIWIILYMQYVSTELAFTNKRVVAKFGFISKKPLSSIFPKWRVCKYPRTSLAAFLTLALLSFLAQAIHRPRFLVLPTPWNFAAPLWSIKTKS